MSGSSTGQILGYVVGAVVGYFTGGTGFAPTMAAMGMGASVGGAIGGAIDPPKGPLLVGPRLNDLSVQTATYGAVIPRGYGTVALMGNIFWLENNKIKEKKKTESHGGKGGGGGGESKTYSYYATFAVGLCEGPIAGVRRIWVGSKLIYDAGSDNMDEIFSSNQAVDLFTVHTGSDTQMPDDRMQATLGVDNTPAYRGLAYIVLKDYPLKDHGNSLLGAQVKVEVVTSAPAIPVSVEPLGTTDLDHIAPYLSADETILFSSEMQGTTGNYYRTVSIWAVTGNHLFLKQAFATEVDFTQFVPMRNSDKPAIIYGVAGQNGHRIYDQYGAYETFDIGIQNGNIDAASLFDKTLFLSYRISSVQYITRFPLFGSQYRETLTVQLPTIWGPIGSMGSAGSKLFCVGSYASQVNKPLEVFEVDIETMTLTTTYNFPGTTFNQWLALYVESDDVFYIMDKDGNQTNIFKIDQGSMSLLFDATLIITPSANMSFSVIGNLAIMSNTDRSGAVNAFHLPFYGQQVSLGSIVQAEVLQSRLLAAGDIDVTALTQLVRGYRVSSVAAIRSAIEPLQGAWPFDVIQAGYKIKFKPRGSAVVSTVPAIDLDAREGGKSGGGVSITSSREMDSILPQRVVIKHIDIGREYDMGEQYAERLNTAAVNIQTVEMPIVMTAGEAAANAEMLLYLYWLERHDVAFSLPPTYGLLEPGDVITVNAASATYELRLTAINYLPDGRLECSAKYNSAAVYVPTALGEEGQSTGVVLALDGSTDFELLDIPLLLDATDTPGFPVAMTGYLDGWPGGILYRTDDAGQTWTDLESFVAPGCIMGRAGAEIGAGRTDLIDKASALTVSLTSGELSSVSESAMLSGSNHFAYGAHGRWEIIAAQNCTLQGDGSYILTDLLRGRFGSEHACASHAAGDSMVLLDSSRLAFVTANLNTIGVSRTYRGVTAGKDISTGSEKTLAYTGVNLECLAPVYLNGNRHPSTNDWSLEWIRRTRVGGEWRDYVDAALGETVQSYEVEIYSSAAYTTLKRTLTGLATPSATYTSAQQVTDFGSNQATLYVKVYQLSANVGRGYPLTTSITR